MTEDQRTFLLQRYRSMETEDLIELRAGDLTKVATEALNSVIEERGIKSDQKREIKEQVTGEWRATGEPYGVGGWLALLVFGMIFLGPLIGAGRIGSKMMMVEHEYPHIASMPEWITYRSATWWAFLLVVAISLYGGLSLIRGREWSVVTRAIKILWITGPLASIVISVIIPLFVFSKTGAAGPEFIGAFIASLVSAGIWTAYLSKSKRVRNTYGDRRPQK